MLAEKANKINEVIDEVMDLLIKQTVDSDTFKYMEAKDYAAIKKAMDLLDMAKKYLVEEAEMLDRIDSKLDRLLAK